MNTDYGVTRTYRLQRNTAERLNELAATLNIFPSDLVDALLARALDEIDDGRCENGPIDSGGRCFNAGHINAATAGNFPLAGGWLLAEGGGETTWHCLRDCAQTCNGGTGAHGVPFHHGDRGAGND